MTTPKSLAELRNEKLAQDIAVAAFMAGDPSALESCVDREGVN